MADSILRLKVDSQEYDNKLKRAAEGLQRYAEGCRKAGGTLTQLDDGVLEFTKSLGQMETVSKSAKGSISEMTKAFTEMSVQYNKLTEEENASPFGQALKGSLDELKGRIQAGNAEIKNINDSLNGGGGLRDALDKVAGTFGLNIDQLTKFGSILGVTTTAVKVAKDAFFSCESNVDEWGRTVAAAEGVYDSFLQSLNNGDFSGFISRIGEVIEKAKEAYNALDELQTRMTIINPERTRLQARATELKAIIRREGANSEKGQAAQAELRQLEVLLSKAFKTESQLNLNAFKAQVDAKLKNAGIKLSQKDYDFLMRTFSSDASYMAMKRGARGSKGVTYEAGGSYDEGSTTSYDTRNINQKLLDLFTDEWRKTYSPLLNAAYSAKGGAASVLLSDARYLKGGTPGGGGAAGGAGGLTPEELEAQLEATISTAWEKAMTKAMSNADTFKAIEPEGPSEAWQAYVDSIKSGAAEAEDSVKSLTEAFEALNKAEGVVPTKEIGKDAKDSANSFQYAAGAIGSVSSALNSIQDPAAKIIGIVGQAIATVAQGFASALSSKATTSQGIWAWIAAAVSGVATMAATISQIHSLTGYAEGGEIKGNSYSGDNIPIMANAGEIILNRAQQANVAQGLQGGNMRNIELQAVASGEQLWLVMNNHTKRKGWGEIVTWR